MARNGDSAGDRIRNHTVSKQTLYQLSLCAVVQFPLTAGRNVQFVSF